MDFNIVKKNKPQLIDNEILQKVIENKKNIIEIKTEPTLINRIGTKIKNSIYDIIEQNIFKIAIISIIIILLIIRYFQYKQIKNNNNSNNNNLIIQEELYIPVQSEKEQSIELIESEKKNNNNNMYTTYNSNNLGNYESW